MASRCLPLFLSLAVSAHAKYGYGGMAESYGYGSTGLQSASTPVQSGTPGWQAAAVSKLGDIFGPTKDPEELSLTPPTSIAPNRPSTSTNPCQVTIPDECVFPFTYKGKNYTTCTGVDAKNALWCSKTYKYTASFAICDQSCDDFPYGAVIGGSVGGAVALAGVGAITGVVVTNQQNEAKKKAAALQAAATSGVAITPITQSGAVPTAAEGAAAMYDKDTLAKVNQELGGATGGNTLVLFGFAAVALLSFCAFMAGLAAVTQARRRSRRGVMESDETVHIEDDEADTLLLEGAQSAEV